MRSVQTDGSTHAQRARMPPACLVPFSRDTDAGCDSFGLLVTHPPSCAPFAPRPLRRFLATMGALTPARLSADAQVSRIDAHVRHDHSVSNHLTGSCRRFHTLPFSATGFPASAGSGLRHLAAGSSTPPGRIEFVSLRTDHSSPIALHLASRRRSYGRLQAGERLPGRDLHPSVSCARTGALPRPSRPCPLAATAEP